MGSILEFPPTRSMTDERAKIAARVERLLGSAPVAWHEVTGGHTPAGRARAELADGRTVFCKWAVHEESAKWLRDEKRVYGELQAGFVAQLLAFEDDGALPLLVLEDLGHARWPPPWTAELARRGLDALAEVAATPPPPGLPPLAALEELFHGWRDLREAPEPFLALGVLPPEDFGRVLPSLVEAEEATSLEGDELLHLDARGDNMAFLPDRVVFVDWNWASVGPAELDRDYFAIHVHATGGPRPEELPVEGRYAAVLAGYLAFQASLPPIPTAPTVRPAQLGHLRFALPWALRVLGL